MKTYEVAGGIVAVVLMGLIFLSVFPVSTKVFTFYPEEAKSGFSSREKSVAAETKYIWNERMMDTLLQSLVILTAVVCVAALMRKTLEG